MNTDVAIIVLAGVPLALATATLTYYLFSDLKEKKKQKEHDTYYAENRQRFAEWAKKMAPAHEKFLFKEKKKNSKDKK